MRIEWVDDGIHCFGVAIALMYIASFMLVHIEGTWFTVPTTILMFTVMCCFAVRGLWHILERTMSNNANGFIKKKEGS